MKKVFLLFAVAAFSLSSMAQIEKDGYKLNVTLENPAEGSTVLPVIVELAQPTDETVYGWGFQIDFPGFEGKTAQGEDCPGDAQYACFDPKGDDDVIL